MPFAWASLFVVLGAVPAGLLALALGARYWKRGAGAAFALGSLAFASGIVVLFLAGTLLQGAAMLLARERFEGATAPPGGYLGSELRLAACGEDVPRVRALLQRPLGSVERKYLGGMVWECVVQRPPGPANDALFALLMPALHAAYRSGTAGSRFAYDRDADYCATLNQLLFDRRRLRQVAAMGLPLHCGDGPSRPSIGLANGGTEEERAELYALVGGPGGMLSQNRPQPDSFLGLAVLSGARVDIEAGLQAGFDPRAAGSLGRPHLNWLYRKHERCAGIACAARQGMTQPLTEADIARIDRLLPVPSPQELDACDRAYASQAAAWRVWSLEGSGRDADYLRELLRLGADLGAATCNPAILPPRGLFDTDRKLSPQLLAWLREVDAAVLRKIAHPVDRHTGVPAPSLFDSERVRANSDLHSLLCERLPADCSSRSR